MNKNRFIKNKIKSKKAIANIIGWIAFIIVLILLILLLRNGMDFKATVAQILGWFGK